MIAIDKIQYLQIGVQGENVARTVDIDMSEWAFAYPDADFHVLFVPYNETVPIPQTTTYSPDTMVLQWTVGFGATAVPGVGYTEIRAQNAETGLLRKTKIIPTAVENSVSGVSAYPPDAYADWVTSVLNAAAAVIAAAHGASISFSIGNNGHLVFSYTNEDEETVTVDLGPVDAYCMAKEAGYTRTRAQFEDELANTKNYADAAQAAAAAAELAKTYAQLFTGAPRAAATAADMTDHALIYVFTGTTTSDLTNGYWYYWDGEDWAEGGAYNSTALTIDTTLTVSGAAADAKKTGDEIGALNSAINSYGSFSSLWENGGISSSNGTDATASNRIRTSFIPDSFLSVTPASTYKVAIATYNRTTGAYNGYWDGTTYKTSMTWFETTVDLSAMQASYRIRVVGSLVSNADIDVSVVSNFTFLCDKVLDAEKRLDGVDSVLAAAPTEETGISLFSQLGTENSILSLIYAGLQKLPTEETANEIQQALKMENALLVTLQKICESIANPYNIPSYFEENLETAIAKYQKNEEEVGNSGDSFIFITDTHWGYNQRHSPDLIRYIVDHSNIRNVICGGDMLDSGSIASEMENGYDFMSRFANIPGGLKCVIGNHDSNKNGHGEQPQYWLTKEQVYSMFYPKAEMEIKDFQFLEPSTGYLEFSYYVDVPATNTRLLFISIPFGSVYQVTIDWVKDQLDDNSDKNFILFSHYLYSSGEYAGGAANLIDQIKGYSNIKAWIFGHIHKDLVLYTSTGIPLVATDTDSNRLSVTNQYTYTIGTITEQAFDIITVNNTNRNVECVRVGRGKHRRVYGGVNDTTVSGTVSLTPGITPTSWESSDTTVATVSDGTVTGVASGSAVIAAISEGKEEYWYVKVA